MSSTVGSSASSEASPAGADAAADADAALDTDAAVDSKVPYFVAGFNEANGNRMAGALTTRLCSAAAVVQASPSRRAAQRK